jgi:hypothetical protein
MDVWDPLPTDTALLGIFMISFQILQKETIHVCRQDYSQRQPHHFLYLSSSTKTNLISVFGGHLISMNIPLDKERDLMPSL